MRSSFRFLLLSILPFLLIESYLDVGSCIVGKILLRSFKHYLWFLLINNVMDLVKLDNLVETQHYFPLGADSVKLIGTL